MSMFIKKCSGTTKTMFNPVKMSIYSKNSTNIPRVLDTLLIYQVPTVSTRKMGPSKQRENGFREKAKYTATTIPCNLKI